MREQVRLWFYSILFMSVTLTGKAPYERVLAYNSVVSEDGSRFSKTGFMIRFDEAAERIGADAVRYLYAGANVASDVRFGYNLGDEARRKMLGLWNIYTFFETYAEIDNPTIGAEPDYKNLSDRWLASRVAEFVESATRTYEATTPPTLCAPLNSASTMCRTGTSVLTAAVSGRKARMQTSRKLIQPCSMPFARSVARWRRSSRS